MQEAIVEGFSSIYALAYFLAMAGVATWEAVAPRRRLTASLRQRWFSNFTIMLLDNALWRLVFPMTAVALALVAAERGWGLLNAFELPPWIALPLAFLVIDLSRYALHYALHNVPALWRLHRMHHTDHDYDFTTGLRFHPIEALLTVVVSMSVIVALGAPAVVVAVSEILVAALAMFSHGNVGLPPHVDRVARLIVVTPDMHRVHHSVVLEESRRNYATVIPWWDRLFGTYQAQPRAGHVGMTIGLIGYGASEHLQLGRMLIDPFTSSPPGTAGRPVAPSRAMTAPLR